MVAHRSLWWLVVVLAWPALADPPDFVPRDWTDIPVRVEVPDHTVLQEFERLLPGRGPSGHDHVIDGAIRLRVTAEELERLEEAGFVVERREDTDRETRLEVEASWSARDGARGIDDFTWPLVSYPTHDEIGRILEDLQNLRPDIALRYDFGSSVDGRKLWGLVVSDHPDSNEAEPEVRLASGIHGDETVQMINLLNLVHELVTGYGQGDARIDALVEGTELHVQPLYNPDGYARGIRYNAAFKDLNRDFPGPGGPSTGQQPETLAFMAHELQRHFVVSLMGHGGALVVNYPWDYTYTRAPDDAALIRLSLEYSSANLPMYNGSFTQGITNGADWYVASGTLQDWVYDRTGCFDVTLEVSNRKWPRADTLPSYWNDNRESLLRFTEAARAGLHGVVTDASTGAPLDATVHVVGIDRTVTTDPTTGDYYKLVDTGTWTVVVDAVGYHSQTFADVDVEWGRHDILDVALVSEATDAPVAVRRPRIDHVAPNPFNPRTRIAFTLPRDTWVELEIVDVRGRLVRNLVDAAMGAGPHEVTWGGDDDSGRGVGSGVYLIRLVADDVVRTASVTLVP